MLGHHHAELGRKRQRAGGSYRRPKSCPLEAVVLIGVLSYAVIVLLLFNLLFMKVAPDSHPSQTTWASKMLIPGSFFFQRQGTNQEKVFRTKNPPFTRIEHKRSIIVITIESLRRDYFTKDIFPKTFRALEQRHYSCAEWKRHDSGAFQRDQGFATLFYSMRAPTQRHFEHHQKHPEIRSWPLSAFKSNGYQLFRMTQSSSNQFCWILMDECDLYERDFDHVDVLPLCDNEATATATTTTTRTEMVCYDELVLQRAQEWVYANATKSQPFLWSLNLQSARFPYSEPPLPFKSRSSPGTDFVLRVLQKPELTAKLKVEQRNFLSAAISEIVQETLGDLDENLSSFLGVVASQLKDTVVVLTSNHGELYMDTDSHLLGNGHEDASDLQRAVPFLMCGPEDWTDTVQVPEDVVTMHSDVFPTLLESFGAKLGDAWKQELGYHSYHSLSAQESKQGGIAFAQYPTSDLQVLLSGQRRLVARGKKAVQTEHLGSPEHQMTELELDRLMSEQEQQHDRFWPGATGNPVYNDIPQREKNHLKSLETLKPALNVTKEGYELRGPFEVDILSIGSTTRLELLQAQSQTWASHGSVRSFWGMTEEQDVFPNCSKMSKDALIHQIRKCKLFDDWQRTGIGFTIPSWYSVTEFGFRLRRGWLCAQRRVGRSLGWLKSVYRHSKSAGGVEVPDYVILVDDDTYIDMASLEGRLKEKGLRPEKAQVFVPCMNPVGHPHPWPFPYGGFSTIFTRSAVERLIQPIHCDNRDKDSSLFERQVCRSIRTNRIGERALFRDGMSVSDLIHEYSALDFFCLHSDWIVGFFVIYYFLADGVSSIHHLHTYPETCNNRTLKCTEQSGFCHRLKAEDMEYFASHSYSKHQSGYAREPE